MISFNGGPQQAGQNEFAQTVSGQAGAGQRSVLPVLLIAGGLSFVIGIGLTVGYLQWQDQRQQLARMTQILENMQQGAGGMDVSRNAPLELLSVENAPQPSQTAVLQNLVTASAPAPVSATSAPADGATADASTADRINALISRSEDPFVSAAIAQEEARRELMSVAIHGVNQLAAAAVAGKYTVDVDARSADGTTGQLRIRFPDNSEDQAELERLLASAAQADMIAFNPSVKGSDGSYDGRVILFDLLERSLSNGGTAERAAAEDIRAQAVALLADSGAVEAAAPLNTAGERFYTVEAGDSLAYISLQFYGVTNDYLRIYEANRTLLSSPEKIQIGQRLLIPAA